MGSGCYKVRLRVLVPWPLSGDSWGTVEAFGGEGECWLGNAMRGLTCSLR